MFFKKKIGSFLLIFLIVLFGLPVFSDVVFDVVFRNGLWIDDVSKENENDQSVLTVVYAFTPNDLNPFSSDQTVRSRLDDVYEPLIVLNSSFALRPGLALTWGRLTDSSVSITIRDDVIFHDGSKLIIDDVKYSLDFAMNKNNSELSELLSVIDSVKIVDDRNIIIETAFPDSQIFLKLSKVPVIKNGFNDFSRPNGTGPYKVFLKNGSLISDLSDIFYLRHDSYWGEKPFFREARILAESDRNKRIRLLKEFEVDFLADVPPDAYDELCQIVLQTLVIPSLEVGFIAFNFEDPIFSNLNMRRAVVMALNRESFLELARGFATVQNQLVSSGVFGFDPSIEGIPFDFEKSKDIVKSIGGFFQRVKTDFYFPASAPLLGQFVKDQLASIGVDVTLFPLNDIDYYNALQKASMPMYFLGWRSETGDSFPFLQSVLHSRNEKTGFGKYNASNYKNDFLDSQIELAERTIEIEERLKIQQSIMKTALTNDVFAVPLFETQLIFAHKKELGFRSRVDGKVFLSAFFMLK